ncbi:MAG TPA: hypothetical protein ENN49_01065 [Bacteroidales bacterium]|nr:hypothetical protein [Bacteroidales bacterium]
MLKKALFLVILISVSTLTFSQRKHGDYQRFSDRVFFGGSLGLAIGNRITQIDVLPQGGIWIFPQWSVGVGGRYTYRRERFNFDPSSTSIQPVTTTIWGYSGFTDILPIPDFNEAFGVKLHGGFVIHGEFENLYLDRKFFDMTSTQGMGWIRMYMVGGGWRQRIGDRAAVNFLVLWDLTDNRYSPYSSNPILRFSVTF